MSDRMPLVQEGIDPQFDLQNHIPDFTPYIEFLLAHSEKTRTTLECELDVACGAREEEKLDLFPAAHGGAPIFIFIHGGWWCQTDRKAWSLSIQGAVEMGYAAVMTDYALCPNVTVPEITAASRAAVAWVYHNAERLNADRDRIFVAGHSAGGQQVGMLAISRWAEDYGLPADVIKGGIPISGLFDMRSFQYSWLQPKLQLTPESAVSESPLLNIPDRGPPLLVTLGGDESVGFHQQSEEFVAAWRARGLRAEYLDQHGKNHNTAVWAMRDPTSEICRELNHFMQSCEAESRGQSTWNSSTLTP